MPEYFNEKHKSITAVIDRYGGTAGIMTVEDVIEELFGDIEDEHDSIELTRRKSENQSLYLSARLEIDYLNETYNWNLPENDAYETLGACYYIIPKKS